MTRETMRRSSPAIGLALLAIVAACTRATEIKGPDGQIGYYLSCNGLANSMDSCIQKANQLCANGYTILGTQEGASLGGMITPGPAPGGLTVMRGVNRHLTVQCSAPAG